MPRKPTLSPTKISMYLACPTKYMWTYLDSRGRAYIRAKSYYSFGTTLHSVLQKFHDARETGVTTQAEVQAAYEESWIDAGFTSAEEMSEAFGEGKEILERYVAEQLERTTEAKTLLIEKQVRTDLGDFVLLGRVDRVDEYPDGSLEIVDYKSGRTEVSPEDIEQDIAMGVYQLLLTKQYPGKRVFATIIALRSGSTASFGLNSDQLHELEFDLKTLGNQILNTNWDEHSPTQKSLCARCDFRPLCSKAPGFSD